MWLNHRMTESAATKISKATLKRALLAGKNTQLKMADLLRIGLERVLKEYETTGTITTRGAKP